MGKPVGFIDAYQDKEFLANCFIPTRCYMESQLNHINFICGRRGTGKSAIVINLWNSDKYIYKDSVQGAEFYEQFMKSLRPSALEDLNPVYLFITIWKHLIITTAMNSVITTKYPTDYDFIPSVDRPIYDYLKKCEYLGKKPLSMWQKIIKALKSTIAKFSNKPDFINQLLVHLTEILENDDFKAAEKSLHNHLKNNGKCIIIIDTILDFFKKEELFINCVEGLIMCVLDLTCEKYSKNLEIKCCIPGELYPKIAMWEKSKVNDHLVPLLWSPKDLIRMISKRMLYNMVLRKSEFKDKFLKIDWKDYQEVKNRAWDRFFPEYIHNIRGLKESTHMYLLRHTQHTPREFIRILNNILSELDGEVKEKINNKVLRKAVIKGVHDSCRDTVNELIESNQYIIRNLKDILTSSFQSRKKVIHISDLRKYLGYSRRYWRVTGEPTEESTIITDLFTMGFLGLALNYNTNGKILKTKYFYLEPNFGLDDDCYLSIHPLFYDYLNIDRSSSDQFVYPTSSQSDYWTIS